MSGVPPFVLGEEFSRIHAGMALGYQHFLKGKTSSVSFMGHIDISLSSTISVRQMIQYTSSSYYVGEENLLEGVEIIGNVEPYTRLRMLTYSALLSIYIPITRHSRFQFGAGPGFYIARSDDEFRTNTFNYDFDYADGFLLLIYGEYEYAFQKNIAMFCHIQYINTESSRFIPEVGDSIYNLDPDSITFFTGIRFLF